MDRINKYSIQALLKAHRRNAREEKYEGSLNRQRSMTVDQAIRLGASVEMNQASRPRGSGQKLENIKFDRPRDGKLMVECWCGQGFGTVEPGQVGRVGVSCHRAHCKEGYKRPIPQPSNGELMGYSSAHCGWCGKALPPPQRMGRPKKWCSKACSVKASQARAKGKEVIPPAPWTPKPIDPNSPEELAKRIIQLQAEIAEILRKEYQS